MSPSDPPTEPAPNGERGKPPHGLGLLLALFAAAVCTSLALSSLLVSRALSPRAPPLLQEPGPAASLPQAPDEPEPGGPSESRRGGEPATVIDLHASMGPLRAQLTSQASEAERSGETVVLETTSARCEPCAEVAAASGDPRMKAALAKVRFLRIDVAEFQGELKALRLNEPTVPWFYLIDVRGLPSDAISADEWDDNLAANIAPVLGAFVHGTLRPRRASWRGETAL